MVCLLIFKGYFCIDNFLYKYYEHNRERIKELKSKYGFTQSDLAGRIDMTYVQIGRYEKRVAIPSADVLNRITR